MTARKQLFQFVVCVIIVAVFPNQLVAQDSFSFMPLQFHEYSFESPTDIQKRLRQFMKEEKKMYDHPSLRIKTAAHNVVSSRTEYLMETLDSRGFVNHDGIELLLNKILQKLAAANSLPDRDRLLIISNSHSVNASNYSRGLFMVSVALLARIETESELAFVLAHELAHDELQHVQLRIMNTLEQMSKNNSQQFGRLFESKDDKLVRELTEYRQLLYAFSSYSRKMERTADSLGLVYCKKAGFSDGYVPGVIEILKAAKDPWYANDNFFSPLDFNRYPFQDDWLRPRLSVYTRKPSTGSVMFEMDSLQTHPELDKRMLFLDQYISDSGTDNTDFETFDGMRINMQFQCVEAAYSNRNYDKCLYYIIDLLHRYPGNTYLVSRAGKIILNLYERKAENESAFDAIPKYTGDYGDAMQKVNTMLHNIDKAELVELGYHFMNINFDKGNKTHYYLLSQIAGYTDRATVREKVEELFYETFEKRIGTFNYGAYYNDYVPASPLMPGLKKMAYRQ
jgi:Zn-dependent protease with chaperone function